MDGRKNNGGKVGNKGGGRKPIALEHSIRELASPHIPKAIQIVTDIMLKGEKEADRLSAAKLLLSYYFGQPKQMVDIDTGTGGFIVNLVKGKQDAGS